MPHFKLLYFFPLFFVGHLKLYLIQFKADISLDYYVIGMQIAFQVIFRMPGSADRIFDPVWCSDWLTSLFRS